jgi:hypothetical protein
MYKLLRLEILKNFNSQVDFADAVGTHNTKVSMVLRGHRKLFPEESLRWQKILKCDPKILKPVNNLVDDVLKSLKG